MSILKRLSRTPKGKAGWPWTVETDPAIYSCSVKWPKISVVTPSYNQGQFIEETIRSVLLQNYPNLEFIVIDGGSSDQTIEIIKKYEPYLTYWVSEPDRGQSHAINKGLEKCTGQIFNWLNSDDFLEPGALHKIGSTLLSNKYDVITGGRNFINQSYHFLSSSNQTLQNTLELTIGQFQFGQPSTYFKMSVVKEMGLLDERLHYMMDVEWWIRYLLLYGQNKVKRISENLVNFRIHEMSKTVSQESGFLKDRFAIMGSLLKHLNIDKEVIKSIEGYIPHNPPFNKSWLVKTEVNVQCLAFMFLQVAAHKYYLENRYDEARQSIKVSQNKFPLYTIHDPEFIDLKRKLIFPNFVIRYFRKVTQKMRK